MPTDDLIEGWRVFWTITTDLGEITYADICGDEEAAEAMAERKAASFDKVIIEHGHYPIEEWDRIVVSNVVYEDD